MLPIYAPTVWQSNFNFIIVLTPDTRVARSSPKASTAFQIFFHFWYFFAPRAPFQFHFDAEKKYIK